ncbi:SRPBCC family protein [Rhodococcus sp. NPDC003318]|uniref:SRPBCC family protein n=1 Tax=Rhodococcus sp. NPDC003318 TaxID=3364503 RepID=UPI003698D598
MGHIHRTALARTDVSTGFAYVDDYRNVPDWMFGVTRFDPVGRQSQGLGAIFDVTLQLGPKALHSRVRITEWERDRVIVLDSIDGIESSSTWRFTQTPDGGTELAVDFDYTLPGGLLGRALAKIVEPIVGTAIAQTEATLRDKVEKLSGPHVDA